MIDDSLSLLIAMLTSLRFALREVALSVMGAAIIRQPQNVKEHGMADFKLVVVGVLLDA
jgi:hypothetical protein